MAGGRSWNSFLKKGLVRLDQAKQQGEESHAQAQTQCDAEDDSEKEEEEFHGEFGPFHRLGGASVSRPPAEEARSGRGIM